MRTLFKITSLPYSVLMLFGIGILLNSGCDLSKDQNAQSGFSSSCPTIDSTKLAKVRSGFNSNLSYTYSWEIPSGANSFNIWFKRILVSGQEQVLAQTTVTTASFTIDSLIEGQHYRFEIQSVCPDKVSGIVIDDIVRK